MLLLNCKDADGGESMIRHRPLSNFLGFLPPYAVDRQIAILWTIHPLLDFVARLI